MGMTRQQLRQRIARNLGGGMVKIELCQQHLDDSINTARDLWVQWAVGDATMEVFFLLMLEGGKNVYDLPAGVVDVLGYRDKLGGMGGPGMMDPEFSAYGASRWYTGPEQGSTAFFALQSPEWVGLGYSNGGPVTSLYTMVDSYLALGHMELINKMRPDKYQWRYHNFVNKLELVPTPMCGDQLQLGVPAVSGCPGEFVDFTSVDSPGFVLIRAQMMAGSTLPTYTPSVSGDFDPDKTSFYPNADENYLEHIYSHPWIIAYSTAYAKHTMGLIRRKFSSNSTLGGATISLDGDSLVSEGKEEMLKLEEELDSKYSDGYPIIMA